MNIGLSFVIVVDEKETDSTRIFVKIARFDN